MNHSPRHAVASPPLPIRRVAQPVCPAGSLRALQRAVDADADVVCLGLEDATNARNVAGLNVDAMQVRERIRCAQARGRYDADRLSFQRAPVMAGGTEFGLMIKNKLDAIGPLWAGSAS